MGDFMSTFTKEEGKVRSFERREEKGGREWNIVLLSLLCLTVFSLSLQSFSLFTFNAELGSFADRLESEVSRLRLLSKKKPVERQRHKEAKKVQ